MEFFRAVNPICLSGEVHFNKIDFSPSAGLFEELFDGILTQVDVVQFVAPEGIRGYWFSEALCKFKGLRQANLVCLMKESTKLDVLSKVTSWILMECQQIWEVLAKNFENSKEECSIYGQIESSSNYLSRSIRILKKELSSKISPTIVFKSQMERRQKKLKSSPPSVARSTETSRSRNTRGRKSYWKGRKKMTNTNSSLCSRCRGCVCSSVANGLCHLPSSSGPIKDLHTPTNVTSTSTRINRLSIVYSSSVSSAPKIIFGVRIAVVLKWLRRIIVVKIFDNRSVDKHEVTDALSNAKQSIDRNKVEIDCILGKSESSVKICSKTKLLGEEIGDLISSLRSFSHNI
uniref:Uncharacterized protein n=1 Tax=Ditylenchus dipsaci TaxID=166011 RepID=A0A915EJ16_9BILA